MPVKHVPYFYTVTAQSLAQETVNVAELGCSALGYANANLEA